MLVEAEDIEERKEYVKIVRNNNELLLQLITDILDPVSYTHLDVYKRQTEYNLTVEHASDFPSLDGFLLDDYYNRDNLSSGWRCV